jgi:hypothetical protein
MNNRGILHAALILAVVMLGGCSQTHVADAASVAGEGQESGQAPGTPSARQPAVNARGLVGLGGQPGRANALAFDASGALLAATDAGVFSFSSGSWHLQGEAALPGQATTLLRTRDGVLAGVSGPQGGAYRLNGSRWQSAGNAFPGSSNGVIALAALGDGSVIASDGGASLYRLGAGGGNWTDLGPDSEFLRLGAIAAAPGGGGIYAGGAARSVGYPRLKHYENGKWENLTETGLPEQGYVSDLAVAEDGSVLAAFGGAGGVFSLLPAAGSWVREQGLPGDDYQLTSGGRLVAYGESGALERRGDGWAQLGSGLPGRVDALAVTNDGAIASSGGLVYRLAGSTWRAVSDAAGLDLVESLAVAANGDLIVGSHGQVLRRAGTSWSRLGDGLGGLVKAVATGKANQVIAGTAGGNVNGAFAWTGSAWAPLGSGLSSDGVLALATRADGAVVAGTNGSGVYLLSSGASNWRPLEGGLSADSVIAHAVTLDQKGAPLASLSLYTTGANQPEVGVYRWDGTNWQEAGRGLSSDATMALATAQDGSILAGTKGGVFKLSGGAWTKVGANLPDGYVTSLAVSPSGSLLAGVSLEGAFRLEGGAWTKLPLALFDNPNYVVTFDLDGSPLVGTTRGVFGEK